MLKKVKLFLESKKIPQHKYTFWYHLGGLVLFLFVIQVVSGIILLFFYQPQEQKAFESVRHLVTQVPLGSLLRSIHYWAAQLMVSAVLLHLASVFFLKAYRQPRESTWVSGATLLLVTWGFAYSGTLLAWDKAAVFVTLRATEIFVSLPGVGEFLAGLAKAGVEISGRTLTRFFEIHVLIFPALIVFFLGIHLFLVQKKGVSVPPEIKEEAPAIPFYPAFLKSSLYLWVLALIVVLVLSLGFPKSLGEKAVTNLTVLENVKPEWYFFFWFETVKLLPDRLLIIESKTLVSSLLLVLAVGVFLVHWLDRKNSLGKEKKFLRITGLILFSYFLITIVLGFLN